MKRLLLWLVLVNFVFGQCTNQDLPVMATKPDEVAIPFLISRSISKGLEVQLYSNKQGKSVSKDDLAVYFTVGWDHQGIYLLFNIIDDTVWVDEHSVWKSDAVEIFISDSFGSNNMLQYTISYYPSDTSPTFRCIAGDYRCNWALRKELPQKNCLVVRTEEGYNVRNYILFEDLGMKPKEGDVIGLQVYVRDMDKTDDEDVITYSWHAGNQTYLTPLSMFPVKLVKGEGYATEIASKCYIQDMQTQHYIVTGDVSLAGKKVRIDDKKEVFKISGDYAFAEISVPFNKKDDGDKTIYINDTIISVINTLISPPEFTEPDKSLKFENEVRYFELMDRLFPPPDSAILFAGSSSFRRWRTLNDDLPEMILINRGFGGSTMEYLLQYFPRLVSCYKPSKIFVYEGDNDIPYGVTPLQFQTQCREFIQMVNKELPGVEIYFLSIKPSPARWKYQEKFEEANMLLQALCKKYNNTTYIDVATSFLDEDGNVKKDVFTEDNLHLNDEGYEIWRDIILKSISP